MTNLGDPTLLQEDEEMLGDPSFELLVRDGEPIVSGSYFIHPPLRAVTAEWDDAVSDRILVRANDGSAWVADGVSHNGRVNAVLHPLDRNHPAYAVKEANAQAALVAAHDD